MSSEFLLEQEQVNSIDELKIFWKKIIDKYFGPKTLCLLIGEVGAGKTESLKQIADLYNFNLVSSPSFAIHQQSKNTQGKTLDHVDLYRIQDTDDLESTGFWDLFSVSESWIFVEWADLVDQNSWPLDWPTLIVRIDKKDQSRNISLSRLLR